MHPFLKRFSRGQLLKLLAVIAMSDGYVHCRKGKPDCLVLTTAVGSEELHDVFSEICFLVAGRRPRRYVLRREMPFTHRETEMLHSRFSSVSTLRELCTLSPTFKTTPGRLSTTKDFLSSAQPTIHFLFGETDELKWAALRLWFDFDGSVSPVFKLKHKRDKKRRRVYEYYQLQFECELSIAETNPSLLRELISLCSALGMRARKCADPRKWSGIDGLRITELHSVKAFVGRGPLTSVKVSAKSRRFKGITKRIICNAVQALLAGGVAPLSLSFKSKDDALPSKKRLNEFLLKLCFTK